MIQKNYILNMFRTPFPGVDALAEIKQILEKTPHKDALITLYSNGYPESVVKKLAAELKRCLPKVKVIGISLFALADVGPNAKGMRMNLIVTEKAGIDVVMLPCVPGEEDMAIRSMKERLDQLPDARAVELIVLNMALNTTRFMEEISEGREELGIFGTVSTKEIPQIFQDEKGYSFGFFKKLEKYYSNQFAVGEDFLKDGFVCVIFSGDELEVKLNYALGWHPIGKEMSIVKGQKGRYAETALTEIDGMVAADLYKEYLGVVPDQYFIRNICEFPLMVRRNEMDICLIPFDYGDNGELYFSVKLDEDEKVRFAFATHDEVLGAVEDSFNSMSQFAPQALFMVLCGNRYNLLREEAKLEWEGFKKKNGDYVLLHGASELFYQNGRGGVLNSAHVAVGMREGRIAEGMVMEKPDKCCDHKVNLIPLAERMSVFMSKMTAQLEETVAQANAANRAKSAFLSGMSHEIRTPINAILGMDEMILRESNEHNVVGYAEDIRSAGNSLLGIVNDVLDFSKIEAGRMDIIPVEYEFASVINDLYNVIRVRAADKGLELKLDLDPQTPSILYGDEIRLKQIITNILTNAVKYTEKGSVTLKVRSRRKGCCEEDKDVSCEFHGRMCLTNPVILEVSVIDTGIGIKKEDIKKLYTAFTRVDEERNRTIEGTGLGLTITRQILSLMDSELKVESTYGKGSTFSFSLLQGIVRDEPVGELNDRFTKHSAARRKYRERFTAPTAHILVVDDTKMNLDVMKNLLKKTRISVDTLESGEEALKAVKENRYDIIFLDHRMPHMDGIECFELMKELEDNKSKDAPVISLTANAVSGAREEYLLHGFTDYLTKPIDSNKLEEMLIRYLPKEKVRLSSDDNMEGEVRDSGNFDQETANRVVLIDDESVIHEVAKSILSDTCRLKCFKDGETALKYLGNNRADLILLDVKMPGMSGFEVIERLKELPQTVKTPVIFLTGDENGETEVEGFRAGAWDYVRKPFVAQVLKQRVRHTIELSHLQQKLSDEVARQTIRADHLTQEVMLALSQTVDAKDHYTRGHSERVAGYATLLADRMGMTIKEQEDIYAMGLLHDVGKIGVAEEIINKPGKLTDAEFARIKQHTVTGYDILKTITELPELATGARWHHEKYDGSGYPDGKAGEDIPLAARIICVADSYDAMTSNRSYTSLRPQENVRAEFVRCRGSQFDPVIADHMISLIDEDKDYLMNEEGYRKSAAALYIEKLLMEAKRSRQENASFNTPCISEKEDEEEDVKLPEWLWESKALDPEAGIKNCGSEEGYLSVLTDFYSTITDKADEIQGYYDNGDWENYTIKVHALKSSARIVGAEELSGKAAALEAAGDSGDIDTIRRDTGALLESFRDYSGILSRLAEPVAKEELPEASKETVEDAYQAITEFCDAMDYELVNMVLDSLKDYRLEERDRECFDKIRSLLSKLDWEGIKGVIEERRSPEI